MPNLLQKPIRKAYYRKRICSLSCLFWTGFRCHLGLFWAGLAPKAGDQTSEKLVQKVNQFLIGFWTSFGPQNGMQNRWSEAVGKSQKLASSQHGLQMLQHVSR